MSRSRLTGAVPAVSLVAVSLGMLAWVGYSMVPHRTASVSSLRKNIQVPQARAWLAALGIELDTLAAAGVSGDTTALVIADLQSYLSENGQSMVAAIDTHNAAKKQVDLDERMVRAGKPPSPELLTAHANALNAAASQRNAYQSAALSAATARLTDQQRIKLATIAESADRDVPPAYRLLARTDAEWVELRDALLSERRATELGEPVQPSVRALLANVRAEPATAAALAATTGPQVTPTPTAP